MNNLLSREGEIQSMNAVDGDSVTADASTMGSDFSIDSGRQWFFVHIPTGDDEGYLRVKTAKGNDRTLHFEKGDNPILIEKIYANAANTCNKVEYRV